ncbi:hypothetical protein Slala03_76460 [Streptomyces lavendulae subsp. lavendulae]|uniref:SMI1/KNR4 family protein n=1 Tax=Streptomyces lavendulae TaxID=1914 RepID=UPI0024A3A8AF|nr:SMI1/KNR4 family protein [Streptomyces lavendulae]GLV87957.1 hypothetical protein Slala03_76460 [Streptomyces lavendulae subsp. lavendulae]
MTVSDIASSLEQWLAANAPGDLERLNPPASSFDITSISENRFPLHPELASWLTTHNGVHTDRGFTGPGGFIPGGYFLLDAEGMKFGQRNMEKEVAWSIEGENIDFVVGSVAHVRWIPIAITHVGTQLVVDHRNGDSFGSILEVDPYLELWGVKRWDGVSQMLESTLRSLTEGTPIQDATEQPLIAEIVEDPQGSRHIEWR